MDKHQDDLWLAFRENMYRTHRMFAKQGLMAPTVVYEFDTINDYMNVLMEMRRGVDHRHAHIIMNHGLFSITTDYEQELEVYGVRVILRCKERRASHG